LNKSDLAYVFLSQELGAQVDMPDGYVNNKVDYKLVAQHGIFLNGITRIKNWNRVI